MNDHVYTPIGLTPFVSKIEDICAHADIYHRCGVKPCHFLLGLDAGNGRSTAVEYVSEAFHSCGIRHFGGMDLFLEYTLDGSMNQLRKVLGDIRSSAVYTNEYEGVLAIDIFALAAHLHESQVSTFLTELPLIGEHATLILFVPSVLTGNTNRLIDKVCEVLGEELEVLHISSYSDTEMKDIIKRLIHEAGVDFAEDAAIDESILTAVRKSGASTIRDAKQLAQIMVKNAGFEHFVPVLDSGLITAAFEAAIAKEVF